jgi:hypothetical protein
MHEFDHEQLDVYVAAIDFVAWADEVVALRLLLRRVAMLVQMVRRIAGSGTGTGTGMGMGMGTGMGWGRNEGMLQHAPE